MISTYWEETIKDIPLLSAASLSTTKYRKERILQLIKSHYSESHRFYHTLSHLEDMFNILELINATIKSRVVVNLAIFFHDIIYNPTSTTNEEGSANLFKSLFQLSIDEQEEIKKTEINEQQDHAVDDYIDMMNQVYHYIILTKSHNVQADSHDSDLQYFIDADMSILGRDRAVYSKYANAIRQEYCHIPLAIYCAKRADFLRGTFQSNQYIYASTLFRDRFEENARLNLAWECSLLEQGTIPSLDLS